MGDDYELFYWRNERRLGCDYVLRKGLSLVAVEVISGGVDKTVGFAKFMARFADKMIAAFLVGPNALPLEEFS